MKSTDKSQPYPEESVVNIFVKRVKLIFMILFVAGTVTVISLVYFPFRNALEISLIDNFVQISQLNCHSLQRILDQQLEKTRAFSNKTTVKNNVIDYKSGKISFDELITLTEDRYQKNSAEVEYLVYASRYVDDVIIVEYLFDNATETKVLCETDFVEDNKIESKVCLVDDDVFLVTSSPLLYDGSIIGRDLLTFKLTEVIDSLNNNNQETKYIKQDEYNNIINNSKIIRKSENSIVLYYSDFCYHICLKHDDTFFITKQPLNQLFNPINSLSVFIIIFAFFMLSLYGLVLYIYVIRYAKDELHSLESCQTKLEKAAIEANIDILTGASSRRAGTDILQKMFLDFQNEKIDSPTIIMFDVDKFKQINDNYGHDIGDDVLKAVVKVLCDDFNGNSIFRWGGDEFVGAFQDLKPKDAMSIVNNMISLISKIKIRTDKGKITPTLSIGISYFTRQDIDFNSAIKRADKAMYLSKSQGGNRANFS